MHGFGRGHRTLPPRLDQGEGIPFPIGTRFFDMNREILSFRLQDSWYTILSDHFVSLTKPFHVVGNRLRSASATGVWCDNHGIQASRLEDKGFVR
jgi:hypothetical protein